ncbi:MAG: NTP transferase domain-containing protein, partial [Rhodobacteraceae bacterium]|nr:NTP transferase domain-containing protein [Paracoccaceae bacterium]
MSIALVILAAGKGTRMQSDLPKVLHEIAGAPMLVHAMQSGAALDPARVVIVAGHGFEAVRDTVAAHDPDATVVRQKDQKGTAHAVDAARDALADFDGDVIVLFGDTPFVRPETLTNMVKARGDNAVVVLGFEATDPGKYGRLVMQDQSLEAIVEYADATDEQRSISFCNSGVMLADSKALFSMIS